MENFDANETYMLLMIVEKTSAHGTSFNYIRKTAVDRLAEIEAALAPAPPSPGEHTEAVPDETEIEGEPAKEEEDA